MPFLPQEGRVLHARRACSRMKKRLFYFRKGGVQVDELTSKRVDGLIDSVGEKQLKENERASLETHPLVN